MSLVTFCVLGVVDLGVSPGIVKYGMRDPAELPKQLELLFHLH